MSGIYVASKCLHAPMWRGFQESGWAITSRWIHEADGDSRDLRAIWTRCQEDIERAYALVAYADEGDVMKGALVEIGMALAIGRPVFVVGVPEHHTWQQHPAVVRCATIEDAMIMARNAA